MGTDESDDGDSTIEHQPLPAAQRFAGRLTVLTGLRNGSGSTRTIAWLKERRGAALVGEEGGGSAEGSTAGNVFLVTLPASGIKVRVPNAWNRTNIKQFTPRRGVAVDVLVVPTLADFQAGRDRAVEAARDLGAVPAAIDPAAELTSALAGNWAGTLDYRDYGNDSRTALPTLLSVTGLALAWTFDDGPGKTVRSSARWSFTPDGKTMLVTEGPRRETMAVSELRRSPDGVLTLVLDGEGHENGKPMTIRTILTRDKAVLRITRMSRTTGQPFIMRHSYQLRPV